MYWNGAIKPYYIEKLFLFSLSPFWISRKFHTGWPFSSGEGPFFPSLMDQTAISRSDITDEKPAMDTPNKYACGRCGRSYLHQATLVRHQRYECGISASYPCQLCGRKFKRRDVLKGHMEKCMNKSVASQINPSSASPMGSTSHLTMSIPSIPTISAISSLAMTSLPYGGPWAPELV